MGTGGATEVGQTMRRLALSTPSQLKTNRAQNGTISKLLPSGLVQVILANNTSVLVKPSALSAPPPTTTAAPADYTWLKVLVPLLLCCCGIGAAVYFSQGGEKKKKKSSKSRARKAVQEPVVSQEPVAQTSLVAQQYIAAPQQMTYTMAPVPTHSVQVQAVAQPMVQYAAPAVQPQYVQQQYVQQQYAAPQVVQQESQVVQYQTAPAVMATPQTYSMPAVAQTYSSSVVAQAPGAFAAQPLARSYG